MSQFVSGVLGVAALGVTLGLAQFAVGGDLSGSRTDVAATAQSNMVNRAGKADRPVGIAPIAGSTIVTQLNTLNDTSVVIRVPRKTLEQDGKASTPRVRRPVACEAPASVLSDIAQQMESGRCVT